MSEESPIVSILSRNIADFLGDIKTSIENEETTFEQFRERAYTYDLRFIKEEHPQAFDKYLEAYLTMSQRDKREYAAA